jgi:hypothetical protein
LLEENEASSDCNNDYSQETKLIISCQPSTIETFGNKKNILGDNLVPRLLAENSYEKMNMPLRMTSFPLETNVRDTYFSSEHPDISDHNGLSVDPAFEALGGILKASEVLNIL